MTVDPESFRIHFERFCDRVQRASGKTFISFKEGVAAEWEGYKEPLRQEALRRIDAASISEAVIGQGEILDRLVSCIEIARGPGVEPNNLVRWENRYGYANRSHHAILDARGNPDSSKEIESWTFEFYRASL